MLLRATAALTALVMLATAVLAQEPARLDRHGDPLPPGAVARLGTSRLRYTFADPHVEFLSDGKSLAVGRQGEGVRLWDVVTGKLLAQLDTPTASERIAVAPDGRWVAAVSGTGVIL
jgi:hypothetical protein